MTVTWKDAGDENRLAELAAAASNAKQRDRYRVVLIAGRGLGDEAELGRERIAATVGRSRQFVDQWVGRYRTGGIDALVPKRQPGAARRLDPGQEAELSAMLESGPAPEEQIAAYNGPILREKIEQRFGKCYSLAGVYKLLHRLGYNDLMPRPRHPDTDPAALDAFKKRPARASGSAPGRAPGQTRPELLPGRGAVRAARHAHARLGEGGLAAAGDPPDAVRLPVRLQRRLPRNG